MTVGRRDSFVGAGGNDTFLVEADATWGGTLARNSYDPSLAVSIAGRNRSFDSYDGGTGSDTLNGTRGNDALFYTTAGSARLDSAGNPVATAAHFTSVERFVLDMGDDVLDLTAGPGGSGSYANRVEVYGDTDYGQTNAAYGDDVLWGGQNPADILVGDTYQLGGTSVGGDDVLHAGVGDRAADGSVSRLYGDAVFAAGGVCGDDVLVGGDGGDFLFGDGSSPGISYAVCGDDTLTGGGGSDSFYGDVGGGSVSRGSDTFVFGNDSGRDEIADFQPDSAAGAVRDVIRISTAYGLDEFGDLTITTNANGSAVVRLDGAADQITLSFIPPASLTAADFEFY